MSSIPAPILVLAGALLLGLFLRLFSGGDTPAEDEFTDSKGGKRGKPTPAKRRQRWGEDDPIDESEAHYLLDRDHHWDEDGRMEEEDGM